MHDRLQWGYYDARIVKRTENHTLVWIWGEDDSDVSDVRGLTAKQDGLNYTYVPVEAATVAFD